MLNYQSFFETAFLEYLLNEGSSKVTIKNYSSDLKHFLLWFTNSPAYQNLETDESPRTFLKHITAGVLHNYIQNLLTEKVPVATINRRLSALRLFFRSSIGLEWIYANPMDEIHNVTKSDYFQYQPNRITNTLPTTTAATPQVTNTVASLFTPTTTVPANSPPSAATQNTTKISQIKSSPASPLRQIEASPSRQAGQKGDGWLLLLAGMAFIVSVGITGYLLTSNSNEGFNMNLGSSLSGIKEAVGNVLGLHTETSDLLSPVDETEFKGQTATRSLESSTSISSSDKSNNRQQNKIATSSNTTENNIKSQTGAAVIPAGMNLIMISNAKVTSNTLIYITPTTSTQNQVIYMKNLYPGAGFLVAIDNPIKTDIRFNWWIAD